MLRPLNDLPAGVIGFEAVGEVHADDYRDVLRPAIVAAAEAGGVRMVYVLGPEFTGYSAGAGWEDTKLGIEHVRAWERVAVVTDVEWVEHLVGGFSWMVPGELRRFALADLAPAVQWVSGQEAPAEPEVVAAPDAAADLVAAAPEAPAAVEPEPVVEAAPAPEPIVAEPEPQPEPVAEPTTAETPIAPVAPVAAFGGQETITPRAPMAPGADMRPGMAQPTPPQPQAPSVPAQWAPDPSGRHHHRWWDGNQWTGHVADSGVSSFDPI